MSKLEELTYYELLNLSPDATSSEVEDAFQEVQKTYSPGSLAVYSVLSEQERERMLAKIREAYSVLTDEERRSKYDDLLETSGALRAALERAPKPTDSSGETTESFWGRFRQVLPPQKTMGSAVSKILRHRRLKDQPGELPISSGQYLESVRKLKGISLEEISEKTKIKLRYLQALEEEEYDSLPKGAYRRYILKALALAIDLDPDAVAADFQRRATD